MDRDKIFATLFLVSFVMLGYAVFEFGKQMRHIHKVAEQYNECKSERDMYEYLFNLCKIVHKGSE